MSGLRVLLLLPLLAVISAEKRYEGFKVIRFVPKTEEQVAAIRGLEDNYDGVKFWIRPGLPGHHVDVLVPPEKLTMINDMAKINGIETSVLIPDVQKVIDDQKTPAMTRAIGSQTTSNAFFNNFQRLGAMYDFIDSLVKEYPTLASTQSIGKTFEGREMKMIKIGSQQMGSSKPILWIDAGIHAREWAAPATALFIAKSLLSEYNTDPVTKQLVDKFEWHILPSANPDGYEYTHTNDRMWRKTRSFNARYGQRCRGTDPNRNFDFHWKEIGASGNPCDDTYAGPKALSEVETQAISNYLWANKARVKLYLSFHAYSQLWLTPWGYTSGLPRNYNQLEAKAKSAVRALTATYGSKYTIGSSTNVLYEAAGGSDDWALGVAGIPYSYTVELRPSENDRRGFLLPQSEILPTGKETWAAVKQFGVEIAKEF